MAPESKTTIANPGSKVSIQRPAVKNLGYFFSVLALFTLLGFFKTYFGLFPSFNERPTALVQVHAFIMILWLAVLIAQPVLIHYRKNRIHRLASLLTS